MCVHSASCIPHSIEITSTMSNTPVVTHIRVELAYTRFRLVPTLNRRGLQERRRSKGEEEEVERRGRKEEREEGEEGGMCGVGKEEYEVRINTYNLYVSDFYNFNI